MRASRRPTAAELTSRQRRAALIAAALIALIALVAFAGRLPFAGGYELRAVFSSANQLRDGADVRIAGVKVGEVTAIEPGPGDGATVTMSLDDSARPVHADAFLTIRPRLVLEGNAYVDLQPGSPDAPELPAGATLPRAQTAVSVQLDQLIDVLDSPTRAALTRTIAELRAGLGAPRAKSGRGSPEAGRRAGSDGLRRAVRELDRALPSTAIVARALRGTHPGDLSRMVAQGAQLTHQLAFDPAALADLVTRYRQFAQALASRDRALAASVRGFDALARSAPSSLARIDSALPALTTFANALRPALRSAPGALRAASGVLRQIAAASQPAELPRLTDRLAPVTARLPSLERRLRVMFGYSTPVTDCIITHVVPTLDMKILDGANTTGDPVYLDMVHLFTGLSSFSSAVDANGGTVRLGITSGDRNIDQVIPGVGRVVGRAPGANGVRPTWLGPATNPPFRPDQACASQALPNLAARSGPPPSWATGGSP